MKTRKMAELLQPTPIEVFLFRRPEVIHRLVLLLHLGLYFSQFFKIL
jgi:hypothetical protein